MKNHRHPKSAAFTLMELLVVISIIAILAGLATTALINAMVTAKIAAATNNAKQVAIALRCYGQDHDGIYPAGPDINTSNDAFRALFPAYMQVEANFAVASSPVGKRVDNKIEPESKVLERGENHWAYVSGLNDSSHPLWPLIVDHTDGTGMYGTREGEPGGTWKGSKAIMIRCDGGAVAVPLRGTGAKRFLPRFDEPDKNALQVREYMGESIRLLEPMR